jgi:hypothetical protein
VIISSLWSWVMRASTCASLRGLAVGELALGAVEACEFGDIALDEGALGAWVIGAALLALGGAVGVVAPDCACASGLQATPEPIAAAVANARMVREAVMFPSLAGVTWENEPRDRPNARDKAKLAPRFSGLPPRNVCLRVTFP